MTLAAFLLQAIYQTAQATNPLENYKQHNLHGFTVMINKQVVKDKGLYQRLIKQVDQDILAIIQVMPEWSLDVLRETTVWFENGLPPPLGNNFFFNGSKKMSQKHNQVHTYGHVVAGNSKSYLAVAGIHPFQLLHELTHAYHQFVTKHNYQPILDAYSNAINKGLHKYGSHYPRKNHKEYFSETTESYFGRNAIYPRNRQELAKHDPKGYCAVVKAWGLVGQQTGEVFIRCD